MQTTKLVFLEVTYYATEVTDWGDYYTAPYFEYNIELESVVLLSFDDERIDVTHIFLNYPPLLEYLLDKYSYEGRGRIKRDIELEIPESMYMQYNLEYYYE